MEAPESGTITFRATNSSWCFCTTLARYYIPATRCVVYVSNPTKPIMPTFPRALQPLIFVPEQLFHASDLCRASKPASSKSLQKQTKGEDIHTSISFVIKCRSNQRWSLAKRRNLREGPFYRAGSVHLNSCIDQVQKELWCLASGFTKVILAQRDCIDYQLPLSLWISMTYLSAEASGRESSLS